MRQLFVLLAIAVALPGFSQSMKVVVDSCGNVLGRYVRTNSCTYTVGVQDIFDVSKKCNKVVTYSAKKGQGILWCKNIGRLKVYSKPSAKSTVIGHLVYESGYVPDTYPCTGKKGKWYKVRVDGREGYVPAKQVQWDAIDTF